MAGFPTAGHLVSWATFAPIDKNSAGNSTSSLPPDHLARTASSDDHRLRFAAACPAEVLFSSHIKLGSRAWGRERSCACRPACSPTAGHVRGS
ncbi:hypothetical protein [Streptosporangium sp. NPDC000396]|uniref:hypothetical protein n=1 Tax=Streptosporangium sp. NPDC000396 TaxID=3366185 RepID=UPI00368F298D